MKIKKCPYCSGIAKFGEYNHGNFHYLYCTNCGSHTKLFPKKYDALMVWNYGEVIKK